ncbi:hypothetical protein pipiens_008346 [Culex pipiens pipiens]|uniref:Uncharacterized protein n=1 Tax=Culex pipiens pipiens TaxID=38569 RepID=A0ABD1DHW9_CULPP
MAPLRPNRSDPNRRFQRPSVVPLPSGGQSRNLDQRRIVRWFIRLASIRLRRIQLPYRLTVVAKRAESSCVTWKIKSPRVAKT